MPPGGRLPGLEKRTRDTTLLGLDERSIRILRVHRGRGEGTHPPPALVLKGAKGTPRPEASARDNPCS